jgi:hypothetical protein
MNTHWAIYFSPHPSSFYHTHPQEGESRLNLFDEQDGGNGLTNQNRSRGCPCDFPSGDLSHRRWGQSMASLVQSLARSLVVNLYMLLFLTMHALVKGNFCVANPDHLPHRIGCKESPRWSLRIYAVRRRKYDVSSRSPSRRSCNPSIHDT